jgi:hypothetical protein
MSRENFMIPKNPIPDLIPLALTQLCTVVLLVGEESTAFRFPSPHEA